MGIPREEGQLLKIIESLRKKVSELEHRLAVTSLKADLGHQFMTRYEGILADADLQNAYDNSGDGTITLDSSIGPFTVGDDAIVPPLNITERSTEPSSPSTNDIYLDDGTNTGASDPGFRRYTGSTWEDVNAHPHRLFTHNSNIVDGDSLTVSAAGLQVKRDPKTAVKGELEENSGGVSMAAATATHAGVMVAADKVVVDQAVTQDGLRALTGDWDNTGQRLRNTGVAEVSGSAPTTPATGVVWLDTASSGSGGTGIVSVREISASETITTSDNVVLVDATSAAVTVTLPAVSGNSGRVFHIKKIDASGNAVTVDGASSETIDDATTGILASQYDAIKIVCDGSEWWIV